VDVQSPTSFMKNIHRRTSSSHTAGVKPASSNSTNRAPGPFGPWRQLRVLAGLRVNLVFGLRAPLRLPTSVPAVCYTRLSTFHRSGCAQRIHH
jgi:hypothetical protein